MKFSEVRKTTDGRYYTKATTDENTQVTVQIDKVKVSDFSMLTFLDDTNTNKITDIDTENKAAAVDNSESWFGKVLSERQLKAAYVSSMQEGVMNISKVTIGRKSVMKVFDHEHNEINVDDIDNELMCDVVIEFSGLWFLRNSFGPIWRLAQIRCHRPKKISYTSACLFSKDEQADSGSDIEDDDDFV